MFMGFALLQILEPVSFYVIFYYDGLLTTTESTLYVATVATVE